MSQNNSYENRILNKTNYYLKRNVENTKKYQNNSKYTNWLDRKKVPDYQFSYETEDGLKIRISKRQKNKPKVLEIKHFMVGLEGKEVGMDELASFIALYTIRDKQKIREVSRVISPSVRSTSVNKEKVEMERVEDAPEELFIVENHEEIPDSWETLV